MSSATEGTRDGSRNSSAARGRDRTTDGGTRDGSRRAGSTAARPEGIADGRTRDGSFHAGFARGLPRNRGARCLKDALAHK